MWWATYMFSELFNMDADWRRRLKPVIFTPETMLANKMMRRMMADKRSLVIVVDEFGGTSGLVTLEDLVEEIFGEIEDEHDHKRIVARKVNDNSFMFSGRVEISAVNEEFGLDLRERARNTIRLPDTYSRTLRLFPHRVTYWK